MEQPPHVVLLDTGINWNQGKYSNLQLMATQSFYNEPLFVDTVTHGEKMLDILSENLTGKAKISVGKVINNAGKGTPSGFSHGLIWAAGLYPDVVVIPLGLVKPNSSVKAALEILANTNCKVYAAVGDPEVAQSRSLYPAAYPECIAVGSACYQSDYATWSSKPNLIMREFKTATRKLKSVQMGTETATMLAVAEYLNRNKKAAAF